MFSPINAISLSYHFIKERKAGGKIALQRVQTTRDRYGVDSVFQSTEIREQIKQTSLERYGCISFLDSSQGRKCLMSSSLARWGVLHPSQADEIKIKKEETTFLHYEESKKEIQPYLSKLVCLICSLISVD
jgi:hypothetical protein